MKDRTDSAYKLNEASLWTRLCDEVRIRAHTPNKFETSLRSIYDGCAGPTFDVQVLGIVLDLHLPEGPCQ